MLRNSIWILCLSLILTSCSLFQNNKAANRHAICKQLRHEIIFNGIAQNSLQAQQERAEMGKLNQEYRDQNCS